MLVGSPAAAARVGSSTGPAGNLYLLLLTLPLTALSLLATGFEFGIANNVFHIPLVLSWDTLPQFRDDAFYASLRYFTSAFWIPLRYVATEENVETLFFTCHVVSRAAAVFGALYLVRTVAIKGKLGLAVVGAGVMVSPGLLGSSAVGGHGLFMSYFTHSELTWPFVLCALTESYRKRFRVAAIHAGVTFLINAFVGVWLVVALCFGAFFNLKDHQRRDLWQLPGLLALICLPVVLWINAAINVDLVSSEFSFREYVRNFYSHHFLIEGASPGRVLDFLGVSLAAVVCCRELAARRLQWEVVGLFAVFAVGVPLPYLVDHRVVFNLHLLRIDGVLQFLFVLLSLAVAWNRIDDRCWLTRMSGVVISVAVLNQMSALCVLFALLTPRLVDPAGSVAKAAGIAALTLLLEQLIGENAGYSAMYPIAGLFLLGAEPRSRWRMPWIRPAVILLLLLSFVSAYLLHAGMLRLVAVTLCWGAILHVTLPILRVERVALYALCVCLVAQGLGIVEIAAERARGALALKERSRDYFELTRWLREQPSRGPILAALPPSEGAGEDWGPATYNLQLHSRKPVWVDRKQGAAVMWQPSFHATWRLRHDAVARLRTAQDFHDYAKANAIRWMVLNAESGGAGCPGSNPSPAFERGRYRVCYMDWSNHPELPGVFGRPDE